MSETRRPSVVIGGATGFIGQALGRALRDDFRVIGISRRAREPDADFAEWRAGDLFSALDAERALEGADYAVYLVHSMMPSAHLTQGSFRDFDLICADNFARAAKKRGVRQIVYLGGLVPEGSRLSPHLASRLEVERTLGGHGVPVTALRAGLVIGAGGSSFEIVQRLVERLPAMLCPSWTATRMQPIALDDVVALLRFCIGREPCFGQDFDVGSPDVLTYRQLMGLAGEILGKRRPMVPVPLLSVRLSRFWVSLVTGAPRDLVAPLVESLEHEMITKDRRLHAMAGVPGMAAREALERAFAKAPGGVTSHAARRAPSDRRVRSVQRLTLPEGRDAAWAAEEYVRWLPQFFRGLIRVEVDDARRCTFSLAVLDLPLLVLSHAPERSSPDRQLFYITGGALARKAERSRFELRQVLGGNVLIAAIHDYEPRLPWPIYTTTQAPFHAGVMEAFGRHLARGSRAAPRSLKGVLAAKISGGEP